MKKLIALLIIAGSIILVWCSKTPTQESDDTATIWSKNVFKWTVKDLLKKEESLVCSFAFEDGKSKENWTIYVHQWKIKSIWNIELKEENISIEANIITDNEYTYTRSNTQDQWAKFKNIDANSEQQYKEDPLNDKDLQFICEQTEVDENIFTIPTNITFIDITEYLMK